MDNDLKTQFKTEVEEAMRTWSTMMKEALDNHFGKSKVGHVLILFPFGNDTSVSWISDARHYSIANMLRMLADHIESPNAKIIRPN